MRNFNFASLLLAKSGRTAAVLICQAVFLLSFASLAQASVISPDANLVFGQVSVASGSDKKVLSVKTNIAVPVHFQIYKADSSVSPAYTLTAAPAGTDPLLSLADWLTANVPAGNYKVRAMAEANGSTVYSSFASVTVEPFVGAVPKLAWLKPRETAVSGQVLLAASSSLSGVKVSFFYRPADGTTNNYIGQGLVADSAVASFYWDTIKLADGGYVLVAKVEGYPTSQIEKAVTVKNNLVTTTNSGTSPAATTTVAETPTSVTAPAETAVLPLKIYFLTTNPTSTTGSTIRLYARPNQAVDKVEFDLVGSDRTETFTGSQGANESYYFDWNPAVWPLGSYQLSVTATKGGAYYSAFANIAKLAPTVSAVEPATTTVPTEPQPAETAPATTTEAVSKVETVLPSLNNGVASGWVKLVAKTSANIKKVVFKLHNGDQASVLGVATFNSLAGAWQLGWESGSQPDGTYSIRAVGYDNLGTAVTGNSVSFVLKNQPAVAPAPSATKTVVATPTPVTTATPAPAPNAITATTSQSAPTAITAPAAVSAPAPQPAPAPVLPAKPVPVATTAPKEPAVIAQPEPAEPAPANEASAPARLECERVGISGSVQCELYLWGLLATKECRAAGSASRADCAGLAVSKYGQPSICQKLSAERCRQIIETVALGDFVPSQVIAEAKEEVDSIIGKNITIERASTTAVIKINGPESSSELAAEQSQRLLPILPFGQKQAKVSVALLPAAPWKDGDGSQLPALLVIDSDQDELTDDLERRLGTDPSQADSDQDGYSDGEEVKSGHNPLGKGVLVGELKPIDKAIINRKPLAQPKHSGELKADELKVEAVSSPAEPAAPASPAMVLRGKARANEVVTLYIYSALPLVVTVLADENGNWQYSFSEQLSEGKHEAFVVLNDDQGQIEAKSAPFSFFVSEARAISQDDLLKADINVYNQTDTMIVWYVAAGSVLIFFLIAMYYLYAKGKRNTVVD